MSQATTIPAKSVELQSTNEAFRKQPVPAYNTSIAGFESVKHLLTSRPIQRRKTRPKQKKS